MHEQRENDVEKARTETPPRDKITVRVGLVVGSHLDPTETSIPKLIHERIVHLKVERDDGLRADDQHGSHGVTTSGYPEPAVRGVVRTDDNGETVDECQAEEEGGCCDEVTEAVEPCFRVGFVEFESHASVSAVVVPRVVANRT